MAVLVAVVTIGGILYGFLMMRRLDRILKRVGDASEPPPPAERQILLYGDRAALRELCRALDAERISYDLTDEPELPRGVDYRWVAALSADDESNLLICLAAGRRNGDIRTMARCNDRMNEGVFRNMGVAAVIEGDAAANRILARLKG